jgi:DNA-directed RNA polymerase subunit RPC12/RpoP
MKMNKSMKAMACPKCASESIYSILFWQDEWINKKSALYDTEYETIENNYICTRCKTEIFTIDRVTE